MQPTEQRRSKRSRNPVPLAGAHPSTVAGACFGALTDADADDEMSTDDVGDTMPADKTDDANLADETDDTKPADPPPAGTKTEARVMARGTSDAAH